MWLSILAYPGAAYTCTVENWRDACSLRNDGYHSISTFCHSFPTEELRRIAGDELVGCILSFIVSMVRYLEGMCEGPLVRKTSVVLWRYA